MFSQIIVKKEIQKTIPQSEKNFRRLLMTWSSLGMTLAMILLAITEVFKTDMENELHEVPLYLTILLVFGSSTFIMFHGISKKTCLKKI